CRRPRNDVVLVGDRGNDCVVLRAVTRPFTLEPRGHGPTIPPRRIPISLAGRPRPARSLSRWYRFPASRRVPAGRRVPHVGRTGRDRRGQRSTRRPAVPARTPTAVPE